MKEIEEFKNTKRIDWIDMAKGWGIVLVILGHLWLTPSWLNVWLYSFHMPLFFFLSGVTYNRKNYTSFKKLVLEKAKALLIPYAVLSLVTIIWNLVLEVFYTVIENKEFDCSAIYNSIIGAFVNVRGSKYSGLWFIPCIYVTFIIFYLILKISKQNKKMAAIISSVSLVIGYIYATYIDIKLPWGIDAAFVSVFFMYCGFCLKDRLLDNNKQYQKIGVLICAGGYCYYSAV